MSPSSEIHVVDSHTAGEPTRVVIQGGPPLPAGPLSEQLALLRSDFDHYRTAVVTEPRGSDVLVGALLVPPDDPQCTAGVIFFNNVGYLGMCGHGMIGVVATLRQLGRIDIGECQIDTPVGVVRATVYPDDRISISNVESYRVGKDVRVDVPGVGIVVGDVAWGGNWFFLVSEPRQQLDLGRVKELQSVAALIRVAVNAAGYPQVDHIELFGDPLDALSNSRNFVLCPGLEYDRSPCGTGTSAKLACLAADGKLQPGQRWLQEGILGTVFEGCYQWADQSRQRIVPQITARAYITGESRLKLDPHDPFCWGIAVPGRSRGHGSHD